MVNFPTEIPDCDSHSSALLDLFISSDSSICSAMVFPIVKFWWCCCCLSFYWLCVKFSTGCPVENSLWLISCADLDSLCDHFRVVPWQNIFKRIASAAASEFFEWVQVGIDVYIPHHKYQVKPHSSPWFSAVCAAAIVHRNYFLCLYQQNKSSESKVKLGKLVIVAKGSWNCQIFIC